MIKGVFQSCYTNTETSGWISVAVSPDMPASVAEYCEKNIHGKNSHIDNTVVDEKNNTLNLLEIDSDGEYLYLSRTQYGLISRGRPNMFSHTYVFPWDEYRIKEPGSFLTLADTNFSVNEADASEEKFQLEYIPPFSLQEIISKYSINKDNLIVLIGAVMEQFLKNQVNRVPLYIQYDGSDLQLREILYLIYRFVPRFIRKQICAASCECPYTRDTPLIFSMYAFTKHSYVDVFTGKSNVIADSDIQKLKRTEYSVFAIENYDVMDIEEYFAGLEKTIRNLIGRNRVNRSVFQVCHKICTGVSIENMDDDSAIDMFFDVLEIDSQTDFFFDYLAKCFKRVFNCKLTLTDAAEKALSEKIRFVSSESEFHKIYMTYEVSKLDAMSNGEAVEYLHRLDDETAVSICRTLLQDAQDEKPRLIVEEYYTNHRLKVNTFDSILSVMEEMLTINDLVTGELMVYLKNKAKDLYLSYIYNADIEIFDKYKLLLGKLYEGQSLEYEIGNAQAEFWKNLKFNNVKFDKQDFYVRMAESCDIDEAQVFLKYIALPAYYFTGGIAIYIRKAFSFFNNETVMRLYSEDGRAEAIDPLVKCIASRTRDDGEKVRCYTTIAMADATFETAVEAVADLLEVVDQQLDYMTIMDKFTVAEEIIKSSARSQGPFLSYETKRSQDILLVNMFSAMVSGLRERDKKKDIVPLDLWLYLGNINPSFGNPYRILEHEHPSVLGEDQEKVFRESDCLKDSEYMEHAKNYLAKTNNEQVSGIVKKWIRMNKNGGKLDDDPDVSQKPGNELKTEEKLLGGQNETSGRQAEKSAESTSFISPDDSKNEKNKKGLGGFLGGLFKKG